MRTFFLGRKTTAFFKKKCIFSHTGIFFHGDLKCPRPALHRRSNFGEEKKKKTNTSNGLCSLYIFFLYSTPDFYSDAGHKEGFTLDSLREAGRLGGVRLFQFIPPLHMDNSLLQKVWFILIVARESDRIIHAILQRTTHMMRFPESLN